MVVVPKGLPAHESYGRSVRLNSVGDFAVRPFEVATPEA